MTILRANRLTTFSVAADGASVSIGPTDESGGASALVLASECLQAPVMTLPEMASQSLRRRLRDPNLRLVLTFAAADGFRVSFALSADALLRMASTAIDGEETEEISDSSPPPLSH